MTRRLIATSSVTLALSAMLFAQDGGRPASPSGTAAAQVGGKFETGPEGPEYKGGKWIEMTFGRPIKRGRDVFGGTGASYGKVANPDAPVWRAGANLTSQLKTEVALTINGKTVAPGTYTIFIDLKPNNWTFIVSNWKAQTRYDPKNTAEIWGAYGYTADKDVVRAPMTLSTLPFSVEEMSWQFTDVSDAGGKLTMTWDKTAASVPFKIGM
ncbi:MAG TPA: DUF2911 domain-containing protein [Vicinamibacterales bacterium]|jgi:hypothetical protein